MHNFKFSQEGKDTFIALHCERDTKAVRGKDIIDAFEESNFFEAFLLHDEVTNFTELVNEKIAEIEKGEFVFVIGRTGGGKASLLKTPYGDLPLRLGDISVAGKDIRTLRRNEVPELRRKLGIIFQDFQLQITNYKKMEDKDHLFVVRGLWKSEEVGFAIAFQPNMNLKEFYENGIIFHSIGEISHKFINTFANLYGVLSKRRVM